MPQDQLFKQVMDAGLRDWLDAQTQARADARADLLRRLALAMVAVPAIVVAVVLISGDLSWGVMAALGLSGVVYPWVEAPAKAMKTAVKQEANSALASALGGRFSALGAPSDDFRRAQRFGLLPSSPDEEHHEDVWTGDFGGVDLVLHEAHLKEWRGSGRSRRLETVFRGVVVGYRFARAFRGVTVVAHDQGLINGLAGFLRAPPGQALERVRMVDPRFESRFEVWSDDPVEARYLVHPAFCERLVEVETAFNARALRLVFASGRVAAVLDAGDQFESGGLDRKGDEDRLRAVIEQIGALLDLVRTLNERPRETLAKQAWPPG
jgi:hypothetical protein